MVEKTVQMLFAGARASTKGIDGNQNVEKPVEVRFHIQNAIMSSNERNRKFAVCVIPLPIRRVGIALFICVPVVVGTVQSVVSFSVTIAAKTSKLLMDLWHFVSK